MFCMEIIYLPYCFFAEKEILSISEHYENELIEIYG